MQSRKLIGIASVIVPFWFTAVYLILSGLRPEYRHLNQAISELGSWDAPHRWYWNALGYVVPGLVIALLGHALAQALPPPPRAGGPSPSVFSRAAVSAPALALVLSGLLMAWSGVFPGDFEQRTSLTMVLHAIGALGSGVAFLVAAFWLPLRFRRDAAWRWLAAPSWLLAGGLLITGFLRTGAVPGLGQRLSFGCFLAWVGLVGYGLLRSTRRGRQD